MSTTWRPPELANDFTTDFQDMVIAYVEAQYSISDPIKTDTDHLSFNSGFYPFNRPYEICCIETDTRPPTWANGGRDSYTSTGIEIGIRMERLDRNKADPQLGNMEREVIRIAGQYRPSNIAGIKMMLWDGGNRVYEGKDQWMESDWRTVVKYRIYYNKRDFS
jgi:hypothetical protein